MSEQTQHVLALGDAADLLGLSADAVRSLTDAGFLVPLVSGDGGPEFALGDLKAFQARNADNGSGNLFLSEPGSVDTTDLLEALRERAEDMAVRAAEIFATVFPEARDWDQGERTRFIDQARSRFEAILAVASQGAEVDEALVGDLEQIGEAASWAGSPLPQLLVVLRISRDLIVQSAIEIAEEHGRHWTLPLALFLTRVLPAMDRLTDAIARGYWTAGLGREAEQKARYEHVVEHSSDGVYEADLDGFIQYANPSLALVLGRPLDRLIGSRLGDVIVPIDGASVLDVLTREQSRARPLEVAVVRPDGVRRLLELRTSARRRDGAIVGYQGVVRDVTAERDLEADKNEFLALMTYDLRQPLTTILGLGATLEAHAGDLPTDQIERIGASIRRQAERISRLADDLYDISRLEAHSLLLSIRPVDLRSAVEAAIATVSGDPEVEIEIPVGLEVMGDPRRLEQVVANLVENAVEHGAAPFRIQGHGRAGGEVEIAVQDAGPGVPAGLVPSLFNRLRLLSRRQKSGDAPGLGLSLVKGLVEAMGGRVWYQGEPGRGADFRMVLPGPQRAGV